MSFKLMGCKKMCLKGEFIQLGSNAYFVRSVRCVSKSSVVCWW